MSTILIVNRKPALFAWALLGATLACSSEQSVDSDHSPTEETGTQEIDIAEPGFGSEDDVAFADKLWQELVARDYRSWELLPGTLEKQRSQTPHDAFVTRRFSGNLETPDADSTVSKEGFSGEGEFLTVTVMQYRPGYDPANQNWFYAKFTADGTLVKNGNGVPIAGAYEPKLGGGCRGCHRNAPGGNFRFFDD